MWLVNSQCGIVGILLNFHMWTGVKNFRPESGVKFFIHEIGVNFLSGMFNLVTHVKFLICIHFKHVSGVNQVWNRPDLMRIFCTGLNLLWTVYKVENTTTNQTDFPSCPETDTNRKYYLSFCNRTAVKEIWWISERHDTFFVIT